MKRLVHWILLRVTASTRREEGNVLILVALGFVALCGFTSLVVDVGTLYVKYQHAQSASDAGALAGAGNLLAGAQAAAQTASDYALGDDPAPTYHTAADATTGIVTVDATQQVPLWFARLLGQSTATLGVHAKAQMGALKSGVGMVPIAVTNQELTFGQQVQLTDGAGNGSGGNYGFLDFSGNGAKGDETDIENGYDFPLSVGDSVPTKPGVMSGPVSTAIDNRIQADANETACNAFDTARSDCHRVMYLPVIDSLPTNGKKDVTILGFAAFYLEGLDGNGGHQVIDGRFIRMIRPGEIGSGNDYGLYGVRLTN